MRLHAGTRIAAEAEEHSSWTWFAAVVVAVLWTTAAASDPSQWVQLSPIGLAPPPRAGHSAVYDEASNRMIIFGGYTSGMLLNDVWVLTNASGSEAGASEWHQLFPTGDPPSPRWGHAAFYDPQNSIMHVFGGRTATDPCNCELWTLLNATGGGAAPRWQQEDVPCSLVARSDFIAAYAEAVGTLLVAGGSTCTGGSLTNVFSLEWITPVTFPGSDVIPVPGRWQPLATNELPPGIAVTGHRPAFYVAQTDELYVWVVWDPNPNPVLAVLSGATSSSPQWRLINLASSPSDLEKAQFHAGANRAVALMRQLAQIPYMQAWRLSLPAVDGTTQWNRVDIFHGPVARTDYSLSMDPLGDRLIVFGGQLFPLPGGGGVVNDVLVLTHAADVEPAPVITTSTANISFGNEFIGRQATRSFTIGNRGTGPLPITGITASAPEFSVSHNCGASVDPGLDCTVLVAFRPSTNRIQLADITIEPAYGQPAVLVSGTGVPGLVASPASLELDTPDFFENTQGTIILSNPSDSADIDIVSISVATAADYVALQQTNNCGSRLAKKAQCAITVIASAVATGAVSIQSGATTVAQVIPVEVRCTPVITHPRNCDAGFCPLAASIETDAPGGAGMHYAVTGHVVRFSAPATLLDPRWSFAAGVTASGGNIDHVFTEPRVYDVVVRGSIAVTDNTFCSQLPAAGHLLISVERTAGFVDASLAGVTFCDLQSSRFVTLTNSGNAPITLYGTAIDGNAATQRAFTSVPMCAAIAPGLTCPVEIRYTGTTETHYSGTLNIFHSGASSPLQIVVESRVPPFVSSQPVSVAIVRGASATLSATATGTGPLTYKWLTYPDGAAIDGGTTATLIVSPATTTSYQLTVGNSCGFAHSAVATVSRCGTPASHQ